MLKTGRPRQKAQKWPAFVRTLKSLQLAKPAFPTGRPLSAPPQAYKWFIYTVSKLLRGTLENL